MVGDLFLDGSAFLELAEFVEGAAEDQVGLGACPVYGFLMLFGAFIDHGVEVEIVEETEGLFYKAATADTPCGSRDFIAPGGNFASRVTKRTTQWLHSLDREPASVKEDALSLLQNMRSDHVLTLTKGMTPTRQVLFARLRNGDGAAGAVALSDRFFPETKFSWLESLIVQAASRKAGEIVREVAEILKAPPRANDFKPGALTLAGYLACANLGDGILAAWRSALNPNELILPALWAALRCSDPAGTLLGEIIPGIFSVSDEPGVGGTSPRDGLFQELSFTAKHGFSSDVLIFLRNLADRDERYRNFVFSLFSHIDHPVCLEFVIRRMAQAAADPVEPGKGSMTFVWEHPWRLGALFEAPPMPLDCVEWLKRCWQSSNPDWLRSYAFKLWVRFSGDALWATELPADSDESFSERAKRGDQRVAEKLLCKTALDSRWFSFIRHLWADSFEPALDMALKVGNYCAIRALRDVPTEVAERLITGNRNVISDKPSAIAAGLYVGKDTTIALATAALQADTDARSKFRDIGDYFGFNYHGYSDRITIRHLEVLRPFVNLLDDHDLAHISEFCCATGYRDWAQENLLTVCRLRMSESSNSVLSHRVRRLFPTDEELVSDLDQIVSGNQRQIRYSVERWADGFAERSDDPERMVRMLIDWLGSAPPVVKFRVAALAIRHQGSRLTLGVLSRFTASPQWPEMEEYFRDAEYCVMRRSLL